MRKFFYAIFKSPRWRSLFSVVAVFVALEAIVFFVGLGSTNELNRKRESEFNRRVLIYRDHLEEHVNATIFALNSLKGLFIASEEVTEAEFLTHLMIILDGPPEDASIYSTSYAPVASVSACPKITFNSMGETSLDLCLNDELEIAVSKAISTAQTTVSNPYTHDGQRNFSFVVPIVDVRQPTADRLVSGLIINEAPVDTFFKDAYSHIYLPGTSYSISSGQHRLADFYLGQPARKQPERPFSKQSAISVADKVWKIDSTSLAEFALTTSEESEPFVIFVLGTVLATLISLLVFFLIHGRQLAYDEAARIAGELEQSEEKFRLAIENVSDQVVITSPEGIVIYANPAIETTTGYTPEEAVGKKAGKLWGGLMDKAFYQDMWHQIKTLKKTFVGEITNRNKNGSTYTAETKISPVVGRDGEIAFFVGIERDITKEKRLKDQLKAQLEKDEAIFASIGDGLISVDQEGRVLTVNASAEALLGRSLSELQGKRFVDTVKVVDENRRPVPVEKRALTEALVSGKSTAIKSYLIARKDGSFFPISAAVTPVRLGKKIIGAIEVFRDITQEKEVDRMKTEFVSLASHQLRTPLSAIKWFSELLIKGEVGKLEDKPMEVVKNIGISTERMIALVNDLLNISRLESGRLSINPRQTDIKKLLQQLLVETAEGTKLKRLKLTTSFADKLPLIKTDPELISQVYSNLLSNAIKYTSEGGKIKLKVYPKDKYLVTEVADTGIGIAKEDQSKIYTKFYRGSNGFKMNVTGTGLGLYLSKSLIEALGGRISFKSQAGKGTTFIAELPLSGSKAKKGEVGISANRVSGQLSE